MPTKKRTHQFPPEFKTQAVQLAVTSGKARHVVAQEFGVGLSTLTKWIKQHHQSSHGVHSTHGWPRFCAQRCGQGTGKWPELGEERSA
jgi:transposase-like protein